MNLRVLLFSHVRHALGSAELTLTVDSGATVGDVVAIVRDRAAGKLDNVPLAFAVNERYVEAGHALSDGDEVAFIPPVQGG